MFTRAVYGQQHCMEVKLGAWRKCDANFTKGSEIHGERYFVEHSSKMKEWLRT